MGLREDVKKGKISIDHAIEIASLNKDYHDQIRKWLINRKERGWKFTPDKSIDDEVEN
jgi:phosphorylcholine metabolism protein LicD